MDDRLDRQQNLRAAEHTPIYGASPQKLHWCWRLGQPSRKRASSLVLKTPSRVGSIKRCSALLSHEPDVRFAKDECANWPALAESIDQWEAHAGTMFHDDDASARQCEQQHRRLVVVAAAVGAGALCFTLLTLTQLLPEGGEFTAWGDFLATVVTASVIGLGVYAAHQYWWILKRHRAEQCRSARFRFQIQWAAIGMLTDELRVWRNGELERIRGLNYQALRDYVSHNPPARDPPAFHNPGRSRFVYELIDYYRQRRLSGQRTFYYRRAHQLERPHERCRTLMRWMLISSLMCALVQFGLHLGEKLTGREQESVTLLARVLVFLAAGLPIVSTAVRTVIGASEPGRNRIRYLAAVEALDDIARRLDSAQTPYDKLLELWKCEDLIEREHYEWLRLMYEVDAFA